MLQIKNIKLTIWVCLMFVEGEQFAQRPTLNAGIPAWLCPKACESAPVLVTSRTNSRVEGLVKIRMAWASTI